MKKRLSSNCNDDESRIVEYYYYLLNYKDHLPCLALELK